MSFYSSQSIECIVIAKPDAKVHEHSSGKHNMSCTSMFCSFSDLSQPTQVLETLCKWYLLWPCHVRHQRISPTHNNSIEPHIQFTVEIETAGQLPFLDLLLRREEDGSISTSIYRRKPTHTGKYLDVSSHHPQAHKAAVVCTLMSRAQTLHFSILACTDEEVRVTPALQSNGYPLTFIRTSSTPTGAVLDNRATQTSRSIVLPYIKGVSEAVRRILAPLHVRTNFRPAQAQLCKALVHVKDSIAPEQRSGVVYRIPCSTCPMT